MLDLSIENNNILFWLYLLDILDSTKVIILLIAAISVLLYYVFAMIGSDTNDYTNIKKLFIFNVIVTFIFIFILLPSQETIKSIIYNEVVISKNQTNNIDYKNYLLSIEKRVSTEMDNKK